MRVIDKIIVHCSDSPTGRDIRVGDIDEWHRDRGFNKSSNGLYCGYHYIICLDGAVEQGRVESDIGAHCKGQNAHSIGVCLIGRGQYTESQWSSLYFLLSKLCDEYALEAKQVFGHCEFNNQKACPMIDMNQLRDQLELNRGEQDGRLSKA